MKLLQILALSAAALLAAPAATAAKPSGRIATDEVSVVRSDSMLHVSASLVLDSLHVGGNRSLFVTPVVRNAQGAQALLPTVLINGRNMHYAYERGSFNDEVLARYDVRTELQRRNGRPQSVEYMARTPMRPWMYAPDAAVYFLYDTCGCGTPAGSDIAGPLPLDLMPDLHLVRVTPPVTELPVTVHEGAARVQFEVDRTELHAEPFVCRNGQRLDNREQLAVINDSIRYATSDPNVEIALIEIIGYASPESPYLHNEYLATNRSRALAEYLAERYSLPAERAKYDAVPENWGEFRQQVLAATDITEQQRADLLELIDAPTYGPQDFDDKEKLLKTDRRFARLYATKILPEWFPHLRATKFRISTRLRPMSDERLAEVILTTPELLSLNQMMRVARLYAEGSDEFNRTIAIALQYYPDDPIANLNAAVTALQADDLDRAEQLLLRAGTSPEAENARGVLAARRLDFPTAISHFEAALPLPEASRNLNLLK